MSTIFTNPASSSSSSSSAHHASPSSSSSGARLWSISREPSVIPEALRTALESAQITGDDTQQAVSHLNFIGQQQIDLERRYEEAGSPAIGSKSYRKFGKEFVNLLAKTDRFNKDPVSALPSYTWHLNKHLLKLLGALERGNSSQITALHSQLPTDVQKYLKEREQVIIVSRRLDKAEQRELEREITFYAVMGLHSALEYVSDTHFDGMKSIPPILKSIPVPLDGSGGISYIDGTASPQDARVLIFADPAHGDRGIQRNMDSMASAFVDKDVVVFLEGVEMGETPSQSVTEKEWPLTAARIKETGGVIQGWDRLTERQEKIESSRRILEMAEEECANLEEEASELSSGARFSREVIDARETMWAAGDKAARALKTLNKWMLLRRNATLMRAFDNFPHAKRFIVHEGASHSEDPLWHRLGISFARITFRRSALPGFTKGRLTLPPRATTTPTSSSSSFSATSLQTSVPVSIVSGTTSTPSFSSHYPTPASSSIQGTTLVALAAGPPSPTSLRESG